MIFFLEKAFRRARRAFSRPEWLVRLWGLSRVRKPSAPNGLILLQIDGLSRRELHRALEKGEMKFLSRLLSNEHYKMTPLYPGLPTSTPAVQGMLFYGKKTAVPSFSFIERSTNRLFRMFNPESAQIVGDRLEADCDEPLLKGGSSYSNIYSGGADDAHFCYSSVIDPRQKQRHPFKILIATTIFFPVILRTMLLLVVEVFLAFADCFRGNFPLRELAAELKFTVTRPAVCVLLRDLITIGVKMDIARGLPIIHANYLGYDEQSHRRGPSSLFAHWVLTGIDRCIRDIWNASHRSTYRHYDVWVFSDHGQEEAVPYERRFGRTIQEAIDTVSEEMNLPPTKKEKVKYPGIGRAILLGKGWEILFPAMGLIENNTLPAVAAMGPVGHIYLPDDLDDQQVIRFAELTIEKTGTPAVIRCADGQNLDVWTSKGRSAFPNDVNVLLGEDHPYKEEAAADLIRLCCHPNAGDLVILGWIPGTSLSFAYEHGSHAGAGTLETDAFILAPEKQFSGKEYCRIENVRNEALKIIRQTRRERRAVSRDEIGARDEFLRIMTYNVHNCGGLDGRISPERIAKAIARHEPDVVALQELDAYRPRTGGEDQAHEISRDLEMLFHFHPSLKLEEEKYGNAILSLFPIKLIKTGALPSIESRSLEPRGIIWVEMVWKGVPIQIINTHFGLRAKEKVLQAEYLLGPDWFEAAAARGPVILCGDFNADPFTTAYKAICERLQDAQVVKPGHSPRPTWYSRYPLRRIDHVFVTDHFDVLNVKVSRSQIDRVASDHLPLVVDMQLTPDAEHSEMLEG